MDNITASLPSELQTRLEMIIRTIPRFWELKPHRHFTNHGPVHSEQVLCKLFQLVQELPSSSRLSANEIYIVSAAAWLYEIGMQSPALKPTLDFEYRHKDLSFLQLQEIRKNRHLLTERLILGDYSGPPLPLGLIYPIDDHTRCIAEVCHWCSDELLDDVTEILPIRGESIRIRLLTALLRLADQLYIDGSRVDLDLLERFNLPIEQYAKWWIYHYTQTLPIQRNQIPFYYLLPAGYEKYSESVRVLVESRFEIDNNPVVQYLLDYGLPLVPSRTRHFRYDRPGGSQSKMTPELVAYLTGSDSIGKSGDEPEELPNERKVETVSGIPPNLYARLWSALSDCGPFDSNSELRGVFTDARINAWRNELPQANSLINRVETTVGFLYNKRSRDRQNALVLLLRVLSDRVNPGDACRQRLVDLADELACLLGETVESGIVSDGKMDITAWQQVANSTQINSTTGVKVIKILFLTANPLDTNRLRLDEESRAIDQALRQAEFRDNFDVRQHWAVRVADLQGLLLRYKPDIVHFSGHGSDTNEIILEDNSGNSQPVSVRALSGLFALLKDNIRCVVLNACYSEPQAQAIAKHIDCVVGMSESIGDEAAISFASAFYQALGYGKDVQTAFDLGCVQIDMENLEEQDTPKLLCVKGRPEETSFVSNG